MQHDSQQDAAYDLIVIGTGAAAMSVASECRTAGWSVAIVDHRPYGGTCALRGCAPKKVLVAAAEAIDGVQRMGAQNIVTTGAAISWPDLQRYKRTFTDPAPAHHEHHFAEHGIDTLHGLARFSGANRVTVDGRTLTARHIVIATGAEPVKLPIDGAEHLATSTDFLALESLPRRIVLVGGGYIGFEFAHIAARAGAEVTLVNRGTRPLPGFEPELVDLLVERTRGLGVDIRLGYTVKAIRKTGDGFSVEADGPETPLAFAADLAVHSGGRAPALEALDLDAAGVAHDAGKLKLDSHLRSVSNPAIYAAGDATGGPVPLTPVAAHEGRFVAAHLLGKSVEAIDYGSVGQAVFTLPPLARVGLLESEAREQGLAFDLKYENVPDWYSARRVNESTYAFKILVEKNSGRLLGAHVIGPDAADVVNLFALAMRHGLTADAMRQTIFCSPTIASDIEYMLP